jgi:hypothetical protein
MRIDNLARAFFVVVCASPVGVSGCSGVCYQIDGKCYWGDDGGAVLETGAETGASTGPVVPTTAGAVSDAGTMDAGTIDAGTFGVDDTGGGSSASTESSTSDAEGSSVAASDTLSYDMGSPLDPLCVENEPESPPMQIMHFDCPAQVEKGDLHLVHEGSLASDGDVDWVGFQGMGCNDLELYSPAYGHHVLDFAEDLSMRLCSFPDCTDLLDLLCLNSEGVFSQERGLWGCCAVGVSPLNLQFVALCDFAGDSESADVYVSVGWGADDPETELSCVDYKMRYGFI